MHIWHQLYSWISFDKCIHLYNSHPIKVWNISITPECFFMSHSTEFPEATGDLISITMDSFANSGTLFKWNYTVFILVSGFFHSV